MNASIAATKNPGADASSVMFELKLYPTDVEWSLTLLENGPGKAAFHTHNRRESIACTRNTKLGLQ